MTFFLHQFGELFRFYDLEKKHFSDFSKLSHCPSAQSQVLCKEGSSLQYSFTPLIFHLSKKGQCKQIVGLCGAIESPKFDLVIQKLYSCFFHAVNHESFFYPFFIEANSIQWIQSLQTGSLRAQLLPLVLKIVNLKTSSSGKLASIMSCSVIKEYPMSNSVSSISSVILRHRVTNLSCKGHFA